MIESLLRERRALLSGHFLLSSGLHSGQYIQCARLFENSRDGERIGAALARLAPPAAQVVVSPALGGILPGYETARALGTPFLFTERSGGEMELRREFRVEPGQKALIVEDVLTTGRSTREVAETVSLRGAVPIGVLSVIDRGGGKDTGLPARSLLSLPLETFAPENCPLCARGLPLEKPGSRAMSAPPRPREKETEC